MQLLSEDCTRVSGDREMLESLLELDGKRLVELGCGAAANTRMLAQGGPDREVIAFEVDERQHASNLAAPPLGLRSRQVARQFVVARAARLVKRRKGLMDQQNVHGLLW